MFYAVIDWIFYLLFNCYTFEFLSYTVLDNFIKDRLDYARSGYEKQKILLDSILLLSALSVAMWFHHIPYILLLMGVCSIGATVFIDKAFSSRPVLGWIANHCSNFVEYMSNINERTGFRNWFHKLVAEDSQKKVVKFPTRNMVLVPEASSRNFLMSRNAADVRSSRPTSITNMHEDIPQHARPTHTNQRPRPLQDVGMSMPSLPAYSNTVSFSLSKTFVRPRGLANKENLCFFNSIIQVLAHTDVLMEELLKLSPHLGVNGSVLDEAFKIFSALMMPGRSGDSREFLAPLDTSDLRKALYFAYNDPRRGAIAHSSDNCLIQHPNKGSQREQDAAEFLMRLFELLHSSLTSRQSARELRRKSHTYKEHLKLCNSYGSPDFTGIKQLKQFHLQQLQKSERDPAKGWSRQHEFCVVDLDWLDYMYCGPDRTDDEPSLINDVFAGQTMILNYCHSRRKVSITTETFLVLDVSLAKNPGQRTTIEECLQRLTSKETLSRFGSPSQCPMCLDTADFICSSPKANREPNRSQMNFGLLSPISKDRERQCQPDFTSPPRHNLSGLCHRETFVVRPPKCLVIQLMRFCVQPGGQTLKLGDRVKIERQIKMESPMSSKTMWFHLYALILHYSLNRAQSTAEGHYKALIKTGTYSWHMFDDENITVVDDVDVHLKNPEVEENVYLAFYSRAS